MIKRPVTRLFAALLLWPLVMCIHAQGAVPGTAAAPQMLHGHVPAITKKMSAIGRLDGARRLDLAIGLPLRNREALTNLLQGLYQLGSTNFHHFVTPDEFAASFGPSAADYQAVIDFAKAHGLVVKRTHANRALLDVSGSVADIEQAFHVHLRVYNHPAEARTFFAPDTEPALDLNTPVLAISGLDNYQRPQPHLHVAGSPLQPLIRPWGGGGSGGGGGGAGNTGPFQGYDFRNAYAAGMSQDGTGQSVGLFELFGFSGQDIQDYEDEAGISPYVPVQQILIDGASGDDTSEDYINDPGYLDYAFETTGDIEMAVSMAPGLDNVLVYEGPTPLDVPPLGTNYVQDATTTAQINDVLDRMATDNLAKQLSCSYGFDVNLSTVQIFQQFAAQGQSFFLASGDAGAFSGPVDEPADDPNITVVGGTSLTLTTAGAWKAETTWLTPADGLGDPLVASGGGISTVYPIPAWQQGISMTANQGSTTMRNVPDVSLVANNITITWGNDFIGASSDFPEGGTSLATPLWAGMMALVNQQAAANGQPPVGFINPALYAIGKSTSYATCFHDITTGRNTNSASPTKYVATTGYDLCTGWGTMIGASLMQALLAPPVDNLIVTPPLGFTAFGPGGGPFSVASQTYTLGNAGKTPVNWSLVNTSAWLNVSATSGTLTAGAATNVTISLNAAANNFLIGNFSGNVQILNRTAGTMQNRQFDLYVGNGGFETGDLTNWTLAGDPTLVFALAADDAAVAGADALDGQPDGQFVRSGLYGAYLGEFAYNGDPAVGSISQSVATKAGQQYLVSFWLTCVPDANGVTTNNLFAAKWNNAAMFAQTNLNAFGWTYLQFIVPATAAHTPLEFDFNNDPGAFGLDDVTVQLYPGPVLTINQLGSNMIVTWPLSASSYALFSTTNLAPPVAWASVSQKPVTNGVQLSVTIPYNGGKTFYRLQK